MVGWDRILTVGAVRPNDALVRALAWFCLLNVLMGAVSIRMDMNWIWFGAIPRLGWMRLCLLTAFAVGMISYHRLHRYGRWFVPVVAAMVAAGCLTDAIQYYRLLWVGDIRSSFPLPLSLLLGLALLVWCRQVWAERATEPRLRRLSLMWRLASMLLAFVMAGFCLYAQLQMFGATDYRRKADAAVVFGARVHPDGMPSQALYDRTRTGCLLYQQGLVGKLVMSGGRDAGSRLSEPEAMRDLAVKLGVPAEDILLDENGINSQRTVDFVSQMAEERNWSSVLMVSHDYHLSRIKMMTHRAGLSAFTVPAEETRRLQAKPYYIKRELAAWLYHWLKDILKQLI